MLKRFAGPLICLMGSTQVHALDCREAQKLLLNTDEASREQLEIQDSAYTDLKAFVSSKPSVKDHAIFTSSYLTTPQGYEELWCKLKSQEAVVSESQVSVLGSPRDCSELNRIQLESALAAHPDGSRYSLKSLGISLLDDLDLKTGSQWAPSNLKLLRDDGTVRIQSTRLRSPTWIPVVGGMNYCKLISPRGAAQLLDEQIQAKASPREADIWHRIDWKGAKGAYVLAQGQLDDTVAAAQASFLISPGAEVPPKAMQGLARELASRGYLPIVIEYQNNNSILEGLLGRNSPSDLAQKIRKDPSSIEGFDARPLQAKPIYILGHSLGAATLAGEVFRKGQPSSFDHIFLYGATSFVRLGGTDEPSATPLTFLFGENDGLSGPKIPNFLAGFGIEFNPQSDEAIPSTRYPQVQARFLKGLNHFCIVSDSAVGNAGLKKKDGPGLDTAACVASLAAALVP